MEIEVEHAHLECEAPGCQATGRGRPPDDPENEATAPSHAPAQRLDRSEPPGGSRRGGIAGQEVGPAEEAEEEGHDGVSDLFGPAGVNVDEAEAKVGGEGGVDGAVGGAKAEDELPRTEAALGGPGDERKGVEDDGGSGLDPAIGEGGEADVLHPCCAGEGLLLERRVLEAVEAHH